MQLHSSSLVGSVRAVGSQQLCSPVRCLTSFSSSAYSSTYSSTYSRSSSKRPKQRTQSSALQTPQQQQLLLSQRCVQTHAWSSIQPTEQLQELLQPAQQPKNQKLLQQSEHQLPASPPAAGSSSSSLTSMTRRQLAAAGTLLFGVGGLLLLPAEPAQASKLGGLVDSTWEAIGGGPADLSFPDEWLGVWDVTSTLLSVELPEGEAVVPNIAAVRRAEQEDLKKPMQYQVAFMRNPSGKVVYDRRFNTAALLASYYGSNVDFAGRIDWDPKDPNSLVLYMPGDMSVKTRVMRRSEQQTGDDRLETSEFLQQVIDSGDPARPRVKASQCFTKYKWREEPAAEAAGGPAIVATQVVSDYLTPFDSEMDAIRFANKPITTYTYRMAFSRHHDAAQVASAVSLS